MIAHNKHRAQLPERRIRQAVIQLQLLVRSNPDKKHDEGKHTVVAGEIPHHLAHASAA